MVPVLILKLYLVRHGQSEGNLGKMIPDPGLTDTGKQQAILTAKKLSKNGIFSVFCSPLRRSLKTAEIISDETGNVPEVLVDLMESWDGSEATTATEIRAEFPNHKMNIYDRWWPGAEKEQDLYQRARRIENKIRSMGDDSEKEIVAVSHGTFGAVLMSNMLGAPPCGYTRFSQHNCCISTIVLKPGRAKLYRSNDVSHLPRELWT